MKSFADCVLERATGVWAAADTAEGNHELRL
jgi:hypothetical protein